jgi:hypothetical protein
MSETLSKFPAIDEKRAYSAIRPNNHISLQQAVTSNTEAMNVLRAAATMVNWGRVRRVPGDCRGVRKKGLPQQDLDKRLASRRANRKVKIEHNLYCGGSWHRKTEWIATKVVEHAAE